LHTGYREHPQNDFPAFAPRLATRRAMAVPHEGQAGASATADLAAGATVPRAALDPLATCTRSIIRSAPHPTSSTFCPAANEVTSTARADGLLLQTTFRQRYANRTERNLEAVYTFPLPHGAVLLGLEFTLGERRLNGVVAERKQAEADYEEAIDAGHSAVLLERTKCSSTARSDDRPQHRAGMLGSLACHRLEEVLVKSPLNVNCRSEYDELS